MRTIWILWIVLIGCSKYSDKNNEKPVLEPNKFLGEWNYLYSLSNQGKVQISKNKFCPVLRISFEYCEVSEQSIKLPEQVINMRYENFFENICTKTYDYQKNLIDNYYPVAKFINDSMLIGVTNYGIKYKHEYFIEEIYADTLIIYDNRVHFDNGEELKKVRHFYRRSRLW